MDTSNVKQRVIFLVLEGVELLDLASPAQVFSMAASLGAPYSLHFCANRSGVRSAQGLFLGQFEPLPVVSANDLVMIAGVTLERLGQLLLDVETRRWLLDAHANQYLSVKKSSMIFPYESSRVSAMYAT